MTARSRPPSRRACSRHKDVAGTSISVETLKGTVMLSGFAKNATEKTTAESLDLEGRGREGGEERNRHPFLSLHTGPHA